MKTEKWKDLVVSRGEKEEGGGEGENEREREANRKVQQTFKTEP